VALRKGIEAANSPLVVDLSGVRYMDSTGINALIWAQRQMDERSDRLYIVLSHPLLRRLFSILNLDYIFDLCDNKHDANGGGVRCVCS
jgi:anti-anti-sigma factor